jgi:hypothetical protein
VFENCRLAQISSAIDLLDIAGSTGPLRLIVKNCVDWLGVPIVDFDATVVGTTGAVTAVGAKYPVGGYPRQVIRMVTGAAQNVEWATLEGVPTTNPLRCGMEWTNSPEVLGPHNMNVHQDFVYVDARLEEEIDRAVASGVRTIQLDPEDYGTSPVASLAVTDAIYVHYYGGTAPTTNLARRQTNWQKCFVEYRAERVAYAKNYLATAHPGYQMDIGCYFEDNPFYPDSVTFDQEMFDEVIAYATETSYTFTGGHPFSGQTIPGLFANADYIGMPSYRANTATSQATHENTLTTRMVRYSPVVPSGKLDALLCVRYYSDPDKGDLIPAADIQSSIETAFEQGADTVTLYDFWTPGDDYAPNQFDFSWQRQADYWDFNPDQESEVAAKVALNYTGKLSLPTARTPNLTDGLVGHWMCEDNTTGNTVVATVGANGAALNITDTSDISEVVAPTAGDPNLLITRAMRLNAADGDNDEVFRMGASLAATASMSASFWFRLVDKPAGFTYINLFKLGAVDLNVVYATGSGLFGWRTGGEYRYFQKAAMVDDFWLHVVIRHTGTECDLHVNGVRNIYHYKTTSYDNIAPLPIATSSSGSYVGGFSNDGTTFFQSLHGLIWNVRIYNKWITDDTIRGLRLEGRSNYYD